MSTKEKIEAEMQHLDEAQLQALYEMARQLSARRGANTLMSKLKRIKIDAPEDFASDLDAYTNGEKRV